MKFLLFAFVVFFVVVLAAGFSFDDVSKIDDRHIACRNAGQSCSSNIFKQCCTGTNCEIPALSAVGTCKTIIPACVPDGGPCTVQDFLNCCSQACVFNQGTAVGKCGL